MAACVRMGRENGSFGFRHWCSIEQEGVPLDVKPCRVAPLFFCLVADDSEKPPREGGKEGTMERVEGQKWRPPKEAKSIVQLFMDFFDQLRPVVFRTQRAVGSKGEIPRWDEHEEGASYVLGPSNAK